MYRNRYIIVAILMAMLCQVCVRAEIYTLDEAREMYKAGRYVEAAPTFAKELKKKPKNGSLNHWYGVCLYYMGEYEQALKYLEKGVERKVLLSNYYIGEVYAAMYRFEEALEAYNSYIAKAEKDKKETIAGIEQRLSTAKIGQRMMRGVEQVQVIDSLIVDSLSFINYYKLTPEAGSLVMSQVLPASLHADSATVAYIPQRGDVIYMGEVIDGNYDLCVANNLMGHEWSALHSMSEVLNNADNQNYPFLLSDGQTLYFAQDGESSLGGYDLYVTMFNSERGDYMLPQNMGMPFNSPYNDFMLAIDESIGVGWFVTDRNHIPGKLTIYIFLPNETKTVYDSDNEMLASLAKLSRIADTWQEGADYASYLDAIAAIERTEEVMKVKEFAFVVCDNLVYTHSDDFKNQEALRYYNQARMLQRKIDERTAQLEQLRDKYEHATGQERATMAAEIIALEEEALQSNESPQMYENRARRAEMAFLGIVYE